MRNRLPLPVSTIKEAMKLSESAGLGLKAQLIGVARDLCNYDYKEALQGLKYIEEDHPELMDFKSHIRKIKSAQNKYDLI